MIQLLICFSVALWCYVGFKVLDDLF